MSSLSYTKSNSKLLKENLSKSNVRSPKSVKTYIKEMKEEDKLKNAKNTTSPQTEENPTQLKNVLNALINFSSKKKNFSQHNDDGQEEICDFKNIGNLSNISFSLNNSFAEVLSDDEEQEATQMEPVIKEEKNRYIGLDEERVEDNDDIIEEEKDLVNLSNLNVEIIMNQIQSEKERLLHSKTQFMKSKEAYLENLSEIRYSACLQLQQLRLEEKNNQVQEQKRMEEVQKTEKEQVLLVEENYMKEVARKKDEILREVEVLNLEKEKKANLVESLLSVLHRDSNTFQNNLSSIQVEAQNIGCEGELAKILFQELPGICETTHNTLLTMSKFSTTEEEINVISQRLTNGLKILEDIQRLLDGRRENLSSQEEKAQTVKEESSESEAVVHQPEQTPLVRPPPPPHPSEDPQKLELPTPDNVTSPGTVSEHTFQDIEPSLNEVEELFKSLKKKFAEISQEANATRENAQLRPLLSRGIGIINTLSNDKYDSSNKSKLQQILNLINGRPCTIGSDMISSANNPSALAFVKEQLSTRLIALGHDKQVATMSAYASLIIRLWQWYPEVGELILFKLYETCPHLAPLIVSRDSFQTDEEFCRALGIRIKEGGMQEAFDKYLTRMEASAQLYGRIVSMDIENHPHGIQEGWKWIARILIVPLQPTITTALLFGFLSTAGSPLLSHYGKQFRKLLHYIWTAYLPLAEHHIVQGGRSALVSLKSLLEQYQRTNALPQVPEGYKLLL